jgi:hypothetical protein
MSRTRIAGLFVATALALAACGGGSTGGTGGTTSSGSGGATVSSSSTTGTGGSMAQKPQAPLFDTLMPMSGAILLGWKEPSMCDSVEGERKDALTPYTLVFTEPGGKLSHLDTTASMMQNYTYRLRCKAAGVYSDYSNELTGAPQ